MKREYATEKVEVIQTRTTTAIRDKLEKIAAKRGLNVSEYIRYLISEAIQKEGEK